jgi:hypothetical protein
MIESAKKRDCKSQPRKPKSHIESTQGKKSNTPKAAKKGKENIPTISKADLLPL